MWQPTLTLSKHVIFFGGGFNGFSSHLKNKFKPLIYKILHDLASILLTHLLLSSPSLLCSSHAVILTHPQGNTCAPASGPLHLLFLQPGALFPPTFDLLFLSLPSRSSVCFLQVPSLTILYTFATLSLLYVFIACVKTCYNNLHLCVSDGLDSHYHGL